MIDIIKNQPIPPRGQHKPDGVCALMRKMEIGDCTESPVERRSILYVCAKHVGIKIVTRMVKDKLLFWRKE